MDKRQALVLVISDRCSAGTETDVSGPILQRGLEEAGWEVGSPVVVPDEVPDVRAAIESGLREGVSLIVTSGSTGVSARDIAPEATAPLIHQKLAGLENLMLIESLKQTPYAAFSRGLAGIHHGDVKSLLINIPGSPKAAALFLDTVPPLLPHFYGMLDREDKDLSQGGGYREHPTT